MKQDKEKTVVIFRFWWLQDGGSDIIALFPYDIAGFDGSVWSYMHVGQHGGADYNHIVNSSRPATPEEYADLKTELESIGYNLEIRQKRNHDQYK